MKANLTRGNSITENHNPTVSIDEARAVFAELLREHRTTQQKKVKRAIAEQFIGCSVGKAYNEDHLKIDDDILFGPVTTMLPSFADAINHNGNG